MENSFPVIIAISRKRVHIHSSKQGNNQPGISSGPINPRPPALNDSLKVVLLLGEIGWGSLLWNKVRLPEQKDTLFEMLKLIVNYLSCLRLKTLQTIPHSLAHNCFGQNNTVQVTTKRTMQRVHLRVQVYLLHFILPVWQKVLVVVHISDCMPLTDCVLYQNNNNNIHRWTLNLQREQEK